VGEEELEDEGLVLADEEPETERDSTLERVPVADFDPSMDREWVGLPEGELEGATVSVTVLVLLIPMERVTELVLEREGAVEAEFDGVSEIVGAGELLTVGVPLRTTERVGDCVLETLEELLELSDRKRLKVALALPDALVEPENVPAWEPLGEPLVETLAQEVWEGVLVGLGVSRRPLEVTVTEEEEEAWVLREGVSDEDAEMELEPLLPPEAEAREERLEDGEAEPGAEGEAPTLAEGATMVALAPRLALAKGECVNPRDALTEAVGELLPEGDSVPEADTLDDTERLLEALEEGATEVAAVADPPTLPLA
jgi:hypothetical protein